MEGDNNNLWVGDHHHWTGGTELESLELRFPFRGFPGFTLLTAKVTRYVVFSSLENPTKKIKVSGAKMFIFNTAELAKLHLKSSLSLGNECDSQCAAFQSLTGIFSSWHYFFILVLRQTVAQEAPCLWVVTYLKKDCDSEAQACLNFQSYPRNPLTCFSINLYPELRLRFAFLYWTWLLKNLFNLTFQY